LAERVKAATNSTSEIVRVPYEEAYKIGYEDMRRRVPNIDKIKAAVGWQATTELDETIRQMIEYFQEQR
jgi:UDP-glucose 4-epimerase